MKPGKHPSLLALLILIAVSALLSGGCASLLDPGPPPTRMQLLPPLPAETAYRVDKQVLVVLPQAGRELDTDRIALLFGEREIRYLAGVRWTMEAPKLVQRTIVDALLATNGLRGAGDDLSGITSDAKLVCDIRQFCLQYQEEGDVPTAWFAASMQVIDQRTGTILASRQVEARKRASGTETEDLMRAMDAAMGEALDEIAGWVLAVAR